MKKLSKKIAIEDMDDIYICLKCIGDESLREIAAEEATQTKQCKYCKQQNRSISLEHFAKIVNPVLREHCRQGEYLYNDKQEGDWLNYFLQEELGIEYDPAEDLSDILVMNDPSMVWHDGDVPFYDLDGCYVRKEESTGEYHEGWHIFVDRIKHRGRFFDKSAHKQLSSILGEPDSSEAKALPVMEIGPKTRVEILYRARLANSEETVKAFLKNPTVELGPPPEEKATPGRMNPAGISVFYGALSQETAIAEIRPSVGGFAVAGSFKPSRKLRLLSLPEIKISGFTGSIFHPTYESRLARYSFFKIFHALIARPIQPCDELLEYIPTQAVAEYVANVLGFDGILYASAQIGATSHDEEPVLSDSKLGQYNIVLFGAAAYVDASGQRVIPGLESALFFQDNSAKAVKINSVKYTNEEARFFDEIGGETEK